MPPIHELRVPALGLGTDEKIVVSSWLVSIGDELIEGDRVVELLAGDITFDVSSPISGRLLTIDAEVDDPVAVGTCLGHIEPE